MEKLLRPCGQMWVIGLSEAKSKLIHIFYSLYSGVYTWPISTFDGLREHQKVVVEVRILGT